MFTQLWKQVKGACNILFVLLLLVAGLVGTAPRSVQAAQAERAAAPLRFTSGERIQPQVDFLASPNLREMNFAWGTYDPFVPLAIDPRLTWNTFVGGNGADICRGMAVDGSGNIYVSGRSNASWGNPVRAYAGDWDAFVAKLDASGALVWNTFLGASSQDYGYRVTIDDNGNVYVTGLSHSTWGNPVRPYTGGQDAFVAKLDASGALVWNTFLGEAGEDGGFGAFVDGNDNVYITGFSADTWSSPVRVHAVGNEDAFVAKLNTSGGLEWNTFLGGNGVDSGYDMGVDNVGNIVLVGYSDAGWGNPVQASTGDDVFVANLNPNGDLIWNTFLGGAGHPSLYFWYPAIAVDGNGNIYVTGMSDASWGSPVRAYSSGLDAFVAGLDSTGHLTWNTFLGGSGDDTPFSVSSDHRGFVYVSGASSATWGNPIMPHNGNTFAAKLDSNGSLILNLFIGGNGDGSAYSIVPDSIGNIILAGTSIENWGDPVQPFHGGWDGFVARVNLAPTFADVADTYWAYSWIERLFNSGITIGCGNMPLIYCPENSVTRAQMAIFLERGMHGSTYIPSPGTGMVFADVPISYWAVYWIEKFYADGITSGCGISPLIYCPDAPVTRAQMAIFLLRAKHGATYTPPAVGASTGFNDVSTSYWDAAWIKQLAAEGITNGCGSGNYCPENSVTRAEMAKFLVITFNLP